MKFLAKLRVYDTDGLLPDLFGEEQKILIEAEDKAHARGELERQIGRLSSYVSVRSLEEIAF